MNWRTKKSLKSVVCVGVIGLAVLAGTREARATIVEVTDVKIIRGELVGGWFQAIEEVDELIVGDVFVITTEVTNLGSETEYVLNLYGWDLSPENRVEVIGTSGLCATYHDIQPGESTGLIPFCLEQAFKAQETGGVTMNIYVKDWVGNNLCQYTFEFIVIPESASIYYVDADANGANDGSSWTDAYNYLQDALADANSGDEIWVAEGIYTPDSNSADPNGSGDAMATFQLKNGVAIKGGYAGFGEPDPNEHDIDAYETILSGDLAGDDGPALITDLAECLTGSQVRPKSGCEAFDLDGDNDVDENDLLTFLASNNYDENSYNVVTSSETDETVVLDGFIITGGNANGPWEQGYEAGAGMFNKSGSPTVTNCVFIGNRAQFMGGGMYNYSDSSPTLTNCTFSGNIAIYGGGMANKKNSNPTLINCMFSHNNSPDGNGGGMSNKNSSPTLISCFFSGNTACDGGAILSHTSDYTTTPCDLILIKCTFRGNSAWVAGGGMHSYHAGATLTNCIFSGNSVEIRGGGMYNASSSPTLTNCTFTGNTAGESGGAIYNWVSSPTLTNSTFSGNSADGGGAIWNQRDSNPTLTNCILWGNTATQGDNIYLALYHWAGQTFTAGINVSYSDVQGGEAGVHVETGCRLNWGGGNIDTDPFFADANNGDYHLKSQAGRWDANEGRWTIDEVTSPCIDGGDMASPIGYEPFPNGGRVNMGAYGGTADASKSYFGEPICETIVAGDINGDCKVNFLDFRLMALHWLEDNNPPPVTTTYEFIPEQSTVVQTGGFGGTYESYTIEGQFQLTVDFDADVASFDHVDATYGDGWSLGDLFNMTELDGSVVSDTAIDFEGQTKGFFPFDIHLGLAFVDDLVHLTGGFVENVPDGFGYDLDAVAVPEP